MYNDCTSCANAIYDPIFGEKICQCHNHLIRDVDKYADCVSHILKESEERTNAQMAY